MAAARRRSAPRSSASPTIGARTAGALAGLRQHTWLGAIGGLALACGAEPQTFGTTPAAAAMSEADQVLTDADCQSCHPVATEQWARSRHHAAFTNPDFARSYAREPKDFCRDCHAPGLTRPEQLRLDSPSAQALGVGCLDCHGDATRADVVRTGSSAHGCGRGDCGAPHPVTIEPDFGTTSCGRCHEFDFPPESRRPRGTMMQTTMREHTASAYAQRSCASCHLPVHDGPDGPTHDHALASSRDDEAIRAALEIRARREGDVLVLDLTPQGIGHAFPTGDLFRRLEVSAALRRGEETLAHTQRYLDREFPVWRLSDGTVNPAWFLAVPDDRVHGPMTLTIDLSPRAPVGGAAARAGQDATHSAPGTTIAWHVDYERVDHRDDADPASSSIASELRLAHGEL